MYGGLGYAGPTVARGAMSPILRQPSGKALPHTTGNTPRHMPLVHSVERFTSGSATPSGQKYIAPVRFAPLGQSLEPTVPVVITTACAPACAPGSLGENLGNYVGGSERPQGVSVFVAPASPRFHAHEPAEAQPDLAFDGGAGSLQATLMPGSPMCPRSPAREHRLKAYDVQVESPSLRRTHRTPDVNLEACNVALPAEQNFENNEPLRTSLHLDQHVPEASLMIADDIVDHETEYLRKNLEDLCDVTQRQDSQIGDLNAEVRSLHLELAHYKCLQDVADSTPKARASSDGLEITNLQQQLSAVQLVKDTLNKEVMDLHDQLEAAKDSKPAPTCVICLTNVVSIVCLPCRHLSLCGTCGQHGCVDNCPICRSRIEDRMQIFMP